MKSPHRKTALIRTVVIGLSLGMGCYSAFAQTRNPRAEQSALPSGASSIPIWGEWNQWGDTGRGYYANPVLPADFSDIDCIRVGKWYYAITSTFQYSPGMLVLRSPDLVHWRYWSHAVDDLTQIGPELNYDRMNRRGKGIWAGALRYHHQRFYLYFGTPDEGIFMTTSRDARRWEPLTCLIDSGGWDDCCPFFDTDGSVYLAVTHYADNYKTWLFRLTDDGRRIDASVEPVLLNEGNGREANKLYKIGDWYYHLYSEKGRGGRCLMMQRARSIQGPYLEKRQLSQAQHEWYEPNQGGLVTVVPRKSNYSHGREASGSLADSGAGHFPAVVDAENDNNSIATMRRQGSDSGGTASRRKNADVLAATDAAQPAVWYFLTHHGRSGNWAGRIASLVPVYWDGEWPVVGIPDSEGLGQMPWTAALPDSRHKDRIKHQETLQSSDSFDSNTLGPQWEWHYQPRNDMWSLNARKSCLRLYAFPPQKAKGREADQPLLKAGNTLTQRSFQLPHSCATLKMDVSGMAAGQHAGLGHFSGDEAHLGLYRTEEAYWLEFQGPDTTMLEPLPDPSIVPSHIWIRSEWSFDGISRFSYSLDGHEFHAFGSPYPLKWASYRGDRIAIYSFNPSGERGYVDIESFDYPLK